MGTDSLESVNWPFLHIYRGLHCVQDLRFAKRQTKSNLKVVSSNWNQSDQQLLYCWSNFIKVFRIETIISARCFIERFESVLNSLSSQGVVPDGGQICSPDADGLCTPLFCITCSFVHRNVGLGCRMTHARRDSWANFTSDATGRIAGVAKDGFEMAWNSMTRSQERGSCRTWTLWSRCTNNSCGIGLHLIQFG